MDFEIDNKKQDSKSLVKKYNTVLRKNSKCFNYISIEFPILEEKYKFYSRMFTFVHNPELISLEKAWGWVFIDIEKIKKIISDKDNNILFAVLGVETHMGKQNGTSGGLVGYPHIHLVVYRKSEGKIENFNRLYSELRKQTSYGKTGEDIHIDGDAPKKRRSLEKSNISFFNYVIKNSRHEDTYNRMKEAYEKYKDKLKNINISLDRCHLMDNSEDKEIIDFFREVNNRNVSINIAEEKLRIKEYKEKEITGIHKKNGTEDMTREERDLYNCTIFTLYNMKQRGFVVNDKTIFVKKEKTRRTWKKWGTIEKMISKLITIDDPAMYCLMTKNADKLIKNAKREGQVIFPEIELNWFYVEFEDFFLHLPSCTIYKEIPENINCALHNPGITLEMFLTMDMIPHIWLSIIRNQKFSQDMNEEERFKTLYYSTLLPLIQKALVLCLQGIANSGKTTLFIPLKTLIPLEYQTEITKGQFSYSGIEGRRLIGLDDVKPEVLDSGNIKQLLEGGQKSITIEKKNVNAGLGRFEGNIFISANMDGLPESWYEYSKELGEYVLKAEFQVRLAIYQFETKIKQPIPGFLKRLQEEETGKVILHCGKSYARTILKREMGKEYQVMESFEAGETIRQNTESIYMPVG